MHPIRIHSLEYPITDHCNLRCAHCDHASPFLHEEFVELDRFRSDLELIAPVLRAGDFRILGGEPLLHPQLTDFLESARAAHIADSITLVTNGVLLHKAPDKLWETIDRLWVSVYPGIVQRMSIDAIQKMCKQRGVISDVRSINSFHRTIMNGRNPDPEAVRSIYSQCKLAHEWKCYTIYNGVFYKCAPAPFLKKRLDRRGLDVGSIRDGVGLTSGPDLYDKLKSYLLSLQPLEACSYCLGSSGPELVHRQLNGTDLLNILATDDQADFSLALQGNS